MISDISKANLEKGRRKGIKRKRADKRDQANTYAALFHFIESRTITEKEWDTLGQIGIYKEDVDAAGITDYRKLKKCLNMFLDDSPAMAREVMQRSEPQDETVNVKHSGKVDVFNHDVIAALISQRRPSGDNQESGEG